MYCRTLYSNTMNKDKWHFLDLTYKIIKLSPHTILLFIIPPQVDIAYFMWQYRFQDDVLLRNDEHSLAASIISSRKCYFQNINVIAITFQNKFWCRLGIVWWSGLLLSIVPCSFGMFVMMNMTTHPSWVLHMVRYGI